jgi:23S rRNA (cytidine1920-2'-O)/16S rRNA (cytidine1409-2'-O)-methyltransferase
VAKKQRVDVLLVERKLATSRAQAQRLVIAGQVRADGQVVVKPSAKLSPDVHLELVARPRYVSRGGGKLHAALEAFPVDVQGKVCADVGASTGGFTDCLLQHGASKVYALDVGKGILHWSLRQDPRVIVMEQTNARYVNSLPEPVELVTVDASFISLRKLLPRFPAWMGLTGGEVIALIKPQFEAGKKEAARGRGVIRDPQIHRQVLLDVLTFATNEGYQVCGLIPSPITGPKGNREFLAWLHYPGVAPSDLERLVQSVI